MFAQHLRAFLTVSIPNFVYGRRHNRPYRGDELRLNVKIPLTLYLPREGSYFLIVAALAPLYFSIQSLDDA